MSRDSAMIKNGGVKHLILLIRGEKVLLDSDLAALYGVETRVLLQAVRRNQSRFRPTSCFDWLRKSTIV